MQFAGRGIFGRFSTRMACWFAAPYYGRAYLAQYNPKGYISPSATIYHRNLRLGPNIFIGDGVVIFQSPGGGEVRLKERAHIYDNNYIQTGSGGSISIGCNSHIHPRCQLSAYKSDIIIGDEVQIAPNCAFYPYNHGVAPDRLIQEQPLTSRGSIVIEDDAWLGFGVIVLDGVRIGKGAVVGAGSIVSSDIPDGTIALGAPARGVKLRSEIQ